MLYCANRMFYNIITGLQREMEAGREYMVMGRMTFVDLAGSERLKTTQSTGKVLHEAGFINRSLYVLGKVIAGLVRTGGDLNHRDVPYRDSKLTKLLIGSLGGRTRTLLMACVTEASGSQAETLRTLKFSMSCARIRNRPVRFLDPQVKLILELRGEIKRLRDENSQLRTSIQTGPSDFRTSYASGEEEGLKGDLSNGGYDDDDDDVMYNNNNNNNDKGSMMEYRNGHNREHTDSYHDDSRRSSQASHSTPHDRAVLHPQSKEGGGIIREGGGIIREGNSRKSQSLAELRADASAFANRQGGEGDREGEGRNYHIYSNKKPSPNQKSNVVLRKQSKNIDISDKRKSQGKMMSVSDGRQERGMEGYNREMEIRRQQQEIEMQRQQQGNYTPPRESSNMSYDSASHSGNRGNSIDTRTGAEGGTGGGRGAGSVTGAGAGRGMSDNDEYSGIGSNPSHASQGLDSGRIASNSYGDGSAVDATVGRSEPFVSAITRYLNVYNS
jgi:Kinesin motor domain